MAVRWYERRNRERNRYWSGRVRIQYADGYNTQTEYLRSITPAAGLYTPNKVIPNSFGYAPQEVEVPHRPIQSRVRSMSLTRQLRR